MAYPAPRRLQLRRGNTAAVSTYLGNPGELIVNTDNNTLYIHDGVTVGGHLATVNTASINANISSITDGTAVFGNLIPSANVTYSLGNVTHQWRDLFVSNTTIYVGGVPLSIDNTGNLTVNGNTIPTVAYVNTAVANVTVDLSDYALNANVTAANVGMKGYVDNAVASIVIPETYSNVNVAAYLTTEGYAKTADITTANLGVVGYVDQQISNLIGSAPGILDTLGEIAASINDDANVYASLVASINSSNLALKGYVDQANSIQSNQLIQANVGMKGYVDNAVSTIVIPVTYSNINVKAYTETMGFANYGNVNVAAYLSTNSYLTATTANLSLYAWNANVGGSSYGDANVAAYLPTYTGNIGAGNIVGTTPNVTITTGAYVSTFDTQGNVIVPRLFTAGNIQTAGYLFGNGAFLTGIVASSGGTNYSNVNVQAYTETMGFQNYGNVNVAAYLATATITTTGNVTTSGNIQGRFVRGDGGFLTNVTVSVAGNIVGTQPNVTLQAGAYASVFDNLGNVTFPGSIIAAGSVHTAGMINFTGAEASDTAKIFTDVSGSTTKLVMEIGDDDADSIVLRHYSYSAGNTINMLTAQRSSNTEANVSVTGNITATGYLFGNGAFLTGIVTSGGAGTNYSNVNVKAYTETMGFQNYGNVNVASYLGTGQITVSNVKLAPSGNIVFADGTVQTTAASGGSNYGNGNVASYLITNGYVNTNSAYANANVTAYLPTHSGNVGVNNLIGTTPNVTLIANSYSTTFDIYGNVAFGNAAYPVQTHATGNVSTSQYFVGPGAILTGTGGNVVTKAIGSWSVTSGTSNYSFTVPGTGTYMLWVLGNIPNGIIKWNATATISNTNVPVVGAQYAWVYSGGGTPIDFTSIPGQFLGTSNVIVRSAGTGVADTSTFTFGINNTSGSTQIVNYGWVRIS